MIHRLNGILFEKSPPTVGIDVQGVGYQVDVPMSTFYSLPALGTSVVLLTHLIVREDAHQLYGFASLDERNAFRQLIKISGVGPRMALSILSGLSLMDLAQAVLRQEAGMLTRIPGVGKKTAERLLLELKGKLTVASAGDAADRSSAIASSDTRSDIMSALAALGYSEREATAAVKTLAPGITVAEGIRQALQSLAR